MYILYVGSSEIPLVFLHMMMSLTIIAGLVTIGEALGVLEPV